MFGKEGRMDDVKIKESFEKVKEDYNQLNLEVLALRDYLSEMANQLIELKKSFLYLTEKIEISLKNPPFHEKNLPTHIPTHPADNPTHSPTPTDNPTVPYEIRGLLTQNLAISTGNRGVPTDRQTDQQTDQQAQKSSSVVQNTAKTVAEQLTDANKILDSLDTIKKEIRLKFKAITEQEMLVFSTIYQLEEHYPEGVEYRQLAHQLKLSESSIRDYTQKIIAKGIPVDKIKLNNKKILLKISPNLKNIAPLATLIKLRDL